MRGPWARRPGRWGSGAASPAGEKKTHGQHGEHDAVGPANQPGLARMASRAPRYAAGTAKTVYASVTRQSMCPSSQCVTVPGSANTADTASDVASARLDRKSVV